MHDFLWDIIKHHIWCQKRTLRIGYKEPHAQSNRRNDCCSTADITKPFEFQWIIQEGSDGSSAIV